MPVPENWWSCDHPEEAIVLLEDKVTEDCFYACNSCGVVEGEAGLTESVIADRLRPSN